MVRPDPIDDVFASAQVTRVRTPVQLVLQRVLDLILEVFGDVVAMSNVPDSCQGHSLHELVCKRGKVCLDTPHNEAILFCLQLVVELLVEVIGDSGVMIRAEVPLLSTADMA